MSELRSLVTYQLVVCLVEAAGDQYYLYSNRGARLNREFDFLSFERQKNRFFIEI
jgi:hypothetical protein